MARALRTQPDLDEDELGDRTGLSFFQIGRVLTWESEHFLRAQAAEAGHEEPEDDGVALFTRTDSTWARGWAALKAVVNRTVHGFGQRGPLPIGQGPTAPAAGDCQDSPSTGSILVSATYRLLVARRPGFISDAG
ncbi:hypothetical protein ACIRPT_24495 [Streptomyces sp. NPDC101227]|uniref:hypothetical protein n=1 Tax=Streptomyces sp. NPDC101227 TaxID=3366136 RepID=UPI0037F38976